MAKTGIHKWTFVGDIMITFSTPGEMPKDVWDSWLEDLRSKPYTRLLGASIGVLEVNSVQRKSASEIVSARKIPLAVVTDEKLVRGILTAASWFGVNVKAFPWSDIRQAAQHINVPELMIPRVLDAVEKLKAQSLMQQSKQ